MASYERRRPHQSQLKRVAGITAIMREWPDLSGRDAVRIWWAYDVGNEGALETLLAFNRADPMQVVGLLVVVERFEAEVVRSVVDEDDRLSRRIHF